MQWTAQQSTGGHTHATLCTVATTGGKSINLLHPLLSTLERAFSFTGVRMTVASREWCEGVTAEQDDYHVKLGEAGCWVACKGC